MLRSVRLGKEIVVTVANKIGVLADIARIVADHGINILALAGWGDADKAQVMLVTADNLRAIEALQKKSYTAVKESDVLMVELENKPGVLKDVTTRLAENQIDIRYIYGTSCSCGGPALVVVRTNDNERALVAFKKK
jgi:hypothetical protein